MRTHTLPPMNAEDPTSPLYDDAGSPPAVGSPAMVALLSLPETFYRKLEELFPVERMTDEQVATMNRELGHPKDADYRPYCMARGCNVMPRMFRVANGFKCWSCHNVIGFDLRRIEPENTEVQPPATDAKQL